jgi:quercetin dioxygenase-like cupin family protein
MYHRIANTERLRKLPIEQDAWLLHGFENHELIRLHLSPGISMGKHINDWRIIFFVLRGSGSLNVEGQTYALHANESIAVEAGRERFWSNTGDEVLELLAIKTRYCK